MCQICSCKLFIQLIDIHKLLIYCFDLELCHFIFLFLENEREIELCEILHYLDYLARNGTNILSILHTKLVLVFVLSNGNAEFLKPWLNIDKVPCLQLF